MNRMFWASSWEKCKQEYHAVRYSFRYLKRWFSVTITVKRYHLLLELLHEFATHFIQTGQMKSAEVRIELLLWATSFTISLIYHKLIYYSHEQHWVVFLFTESPTWSSGAPVRLSSPKHYSFLAICLLDILYNVVLCCFKGFRDSLDRSLAQIFHGRCWKSAFLFSSLNHLCSVLVCHYLCSVLLC